MDGDSQMLDNKPFDKARNVQDMLLVGPCKENLCSISTCHLSIVECPGKIAPALLYRVADIEACS